MDRPTDTEMLDWLDAKGEGWIARDSMTGRGYRVHQAPKCEAEDFDLPQTRTARDAIALAMLREKQSVNPDRHRP